MNKIQSSFEDRFWKFVNRDGPIIRPELGQCWVWTGHCDKHKRGYLRFGRAELGKCISSRASWIVSFGSIPTGRFVLHKCDNPECVRIDHLYLGTQADNMKDKQVRGRHHLLGRGDLISGKDNPNSRLTEENVLEIRRAASEGVRGCVLAIKYGVTKEAIYHIIHRRTWVLLKQTPTPEVAL